MVYRNRLKKVEENNILLKNQPAFTANFSTEVAIQLPNGKIKSDGGSVTVALFLELKIARYRIRIRF